MDSRDNELYVEVMQVCTMGFVPMALKVLIELDVINIMAKAGPAARLTAAEITEKLLSKNPDSAAAMLERVLRVLASHSVLLCEAGEGERRYGLSPLSKFLVPNEDGLSLSPFVLMILDKVLVKSWYYFKEAILEGGVPFEKAYGMNAFEYHGTDPRFNNVFNHGMSGHSTMVMKKVLNIYDGFEGIKELVDVGGGVGANLSHIISKYPQIKGINYDLKHVIEVAPPHPGVEHISGDMFASIPNGEAIFMKWILHDWSDKQCLKILKNCYHALPQGGKIIVLESILPGEEDELTSNVAKDVLHEDLLMLALNHGGKERTQKELEALAKTAGFSTFNKLCNAYNTWVMEFHK